jgi:hypothetical protein
MNTYLSEESRGIACAPLHIDEILCLVDGSIQCAMEKIRGHYNCCPHTTATKASTLPSSVEAFRIIKWQATKILQNKTHNSKNSHKKASLRIINGKQQNSFPKRKPNNKLCNKHCTRFKASLRIDHQMTSNKCTPYCTTS